MADIITDLDHHWTLNDTLAAAVGGQDGAWDADVAGSPTYTAGVIDKAVDLDASDNQRVDLGTDSSLNITGDRTLAAWIYAPAAMTGQRGAISTGSSWTNNSALYFRDQASNQIAAAFHRVSDNRTYYARAGNLVAESWNHLAATFDESTQTISLYQNGMLVPSSTTTGSTATRDTQGYIGYLGGIASPQYFDGGIDDVRIYSRALSTDDVAELATRPPDPDDTFSNTIPTAPASVDEARIKIKPGTMTSTHQQGVIADQGRVYISNTQVDSTECGVQKLDRYTWAELAENRTILADIDTLAGSAQGYTHIGSGAWVGDHLYYPVSDRSGSYPTATITKWGIVKLAASDLEVVDIQAITLTDDGTDPDAAGLAYDPDVDEFFLCTYDTANDLYRIAGENHATDSYGDVLQKITTTTSVLQAQGICIAKNAAGEKRIYWARAGTSNDQPITELDGTADGNWMLGTDTIIDSNMGNIWIDADGLIWYTRSVSSGFGVLGPAYAPDKPRSIKSVDTGHDSLADCVVWWPMIEGTGSTITDVINDVVATARNQSAGDASWSSTGPRRLQWNGQSGDGYFDGDAGALLDMTSGGDLEDGFTVEAVLMPSAVSGANKGYFVLKDDLAVDSSRVAFATSRVSESELHVWYSNTSWKSSGYDLLADQTYHVAWAITTSDIKVYVNGFLVETITGTAFPSVDGKFNIGRTRILGTEQFEGDIWMIRVHANGSPDGGAVAQWSGEPFAAISGNQKLFIPPGLLL